MNELEAETETIRAAFLVHQARRIGRDDIFGAVALMVADLVATHARGDGFFGNAESAAETAAFIGTIGFDELDACDVVQQRERFRKEGFVDFRHAGGPQRAQRATTIVQPDLVRKRRPRKFAHLQDVVNEFDEFVGVAAHGVGVARLIGGREMVAHVMHATAARRDDVIVAGEIAHEEIFGGGGLLFAAAIAHGLTATGLIQRIVHGAAQTLQQLQGGDAHFGEEGVDKTRYKQRDFHGIGSSN
ncbi:hypothetical protein PT2222_60424 [Paraburkholderia tropica]